jgi:hypothetical protein
VRVERDRVREALLAACADAGIDPGNVVVFMVDANRPADTTPIAYLQPAGYVQQETAGVFRAVGTEQAHAYHLAAHRLAIWCGLPGIPEAALGPMLRHELEHAKRWKLSGTRFFEADEWLRAALPRGDGFDSAYAALPTESEANAASTAYARRILSDSQIAELAGVEDCRDLVCAAPLAGDDVVERTLAQLEQTQNWGPVWFDAIKRADFIESTRASVGEWSEIGAGTLPLERDEPLIELVLPVDGSERDDSETTV